MPVQVYTRDSSGNNIPLTGIIKVAAGGNHTLALAADGTVYGWGDNSRGTIGQGAASPAVFVATKVLGSAGAGTELGNEMDINGDVDPIVDIITSGAVSSAGVEIRGYSFALSAGGKIYGWGNDYHGLLDPINTDGRNRIFNLPTNISDANPLLQNATALFGDKIAANARALKRDGQIVTWGENKDDAYGSYAAVGRELPDRVVLDGRALTVAGGVYNGAAITTDGEVKTWGGSAETNWANGKDASGLARHYMLPTTFTELSNGYVYDAANGLALDFPIDVDISEYLHVAYIDTTLWSVGNAEPGQILNNSLQSPALGQGDNLTPVATGVPAPVSAGASGTPGAGITGVIGVRNSISARDGHSLIMKKNGSLWSYGANTNGRLGDGTSAATDVPVRVGAAYFVLEDYTISIEVGQEFVYDAEPVISAFNVFNNVEDGSGAELNMTWMVWDETRDSVQVDGHSWNNIVDVDATAYRNVLQYNGKFHKAKFTGVNPGTTYVIVGVENDPMISTSIRVEVRPYNTGIVGQGGGYYQDIYDAFDQRTSATGAHDTDNVATGDQLLRRCDLQPAAGHGSQCGLPAGGLWRQLHNGSGGRRHGLDLGRQRLRPAGRGRALRHLRRARAGQAGRQGRQ